MQDVNQIIVCNKRGKLGNPLPLLFRKIIIVHSVDETLQLSPLLAPPYKSAHTSAINNQLFTRFCPQTLFNVSYSTRRSKDTSVSTTDAMPILEWKSLIWSQRGKMVRMNKFAKKCCIESSAIKICDRKSRFK